MANTYSAGIVTAYGAAKKAGYTGTYEEFCAEQANFGRWAQQVRQDKESVEQTVETFSETTVPAAVQSVTDEGTAQVGRVTNAGTTAVGNVNDAGTTQVGNVNSAGQTQVGNVNDAGTTQVGNVQNEGATQVQAVEDKGAEVIASIPSDYSDLTAEVDDLTRQLSDVEENKIPELKNALNNIGYTEEPSINILNPAELVPGRITSSKSELQHTGTYDTDFRTTGFMPVTAGEKYGFYTLVNGNVAGPTIPNIWAYAGDKSALSYVGNISYNADGLGYITAPEGAAYIRASIQTAVFTQYGGTVMCAVADGITKPSEIVPYGTDYYLDGYLREQDLKRWTGKKWVVFGDSLTEENSRTTKHYFDYVSDETGISTYNMGNSGSGYMNEQDLGTAFYQRISAVPTDADVITIFGSFNDNNYFNVLGTANDTGTTTIGGCINTTLDNLFTAFPLANIGIVTPTPWQNLNPTTEPNTASAYVDLLKEICNKRGLPCLDLFHCSQLRPWDSDFRNLAYTKDDGGGTHPDETGHKIIAPRFQAFLDELLLH